MEKSDFLTRLDRLLTQSEVAAAETASAPLPDGLENTKERVLGLPRVGFKPDWQEVPTSRVDRTSTMLSGPFYTNDEFPWLFTDEFSCEPILQIDLRAAGQLVGRDVGFGLLQVWKTRPHDFDGYVIRHIPHEQVSVDQMTPVPVGLICDPENTHACRAKVQEAPWQSTALVPFGEFNTLVSIHDDLQSYLSSLADEWAGPSALVEEATKLRDVCGGISVVDGTYLFGNYYPRGYEASLDMQLMQVSDEHFFWGGDGKAILLNAKPTDPGEAVFTWFT